MFGFILYLAIVGLIAGFLARAIVPGRDSMSGGGTLVLRQNHKLTEHRGRTQVKDLMAWI